MNTLSKIKVSILLLFLLFGGYYQTRSGICEDTTSPEPVNPEDIMPAGVTFVQDAETIKFRKARELEQSGKKELAFTLYQELLDKSPDFIINRESIIYSGIQDYFNSKLSSMPQEDLRIYRKITDPVALGLFRKAKAEGDLKLLEKTAINYFNTSYGLDITAYLADYYLNSANISRALYHYKRIRNHYSEKDAKPLLATVMVKIAACRKLLGDTPGYESSAAELQPFYGELIEFAGGKMTIKDALDLINSTFAPADDNKNTEIDRNTWAYSGGGSLSGHKSINSDARTAVRTWTFPPSAEKPQDDAFVNPPQIPSPSLTNNICILPVYKNEILYFHDGCSVYALDMENGKLFWVQPENTANSLKANEIYGKYMSEYRKTHAIFGCCFNANGNMLFANMWGRYQKDAIEKASFIAAVNTDPTASGRYEWNSTDANPSDPELKNTLFPSPPIAVNGFVYAVGFIISPAPIYYLFCFDEKTGAIIWKKYLPEPDDPGDSGGTRGSRDSYPSPLLIENESVIYILTNYGMLIAVDGYTGNYLWLSNYLAHTKQLQLIPVPLGRGPMPVPQYKRDNIGNFPAVIDNLIYFLPIDSAFFFCLDTKNGKITDSLGFIKDGRPPARLEFLSIIPNPNDNDDKIAYFISDKITGYHLRTGKEECSSSSLGYKPEGRAFISSDCIYMPCSMSDNDFPGKKFLSILRFKLNAAKKDPGNIPLPDNSNPGSLVITPNRLITVSTQRISGFQDSETFKRDYAKQNGFKTVAPEIYLKNYVLTDKLITTTARLPVYLRFPNMLFMDPVSLHYNASIEILLNSIKTARLRDKKLTGNLFFTNPEHHIKMARLFFANNNFHDTLYELKYAAKGMKFADEAKSGKLQLEISSGLYQIHLINAKSSLNSNFFESAANYFAAALKCAVTDEQRTAAVLGIAYSNQKNDNLQAAIMNYHAIMKNSRFAETIIADPTSEPSSDESVIEVNTRTKASGIAAYQITKMLRNCIENKKNLPEYVTAAGQELEAILQKLPKDGQSEDTLRLILQYTFTEKAEQMMRELALQSMERDNGKFQEYFSLYRQYFSYSAHYAGLLMSAEEYCEKKSRFDLASEIVNEISARFYGREIVTGNFSTIISSYVDAKKGRLSRLIDLWSAIETPQALPVANFSAPVSELPKTDGDRNILFAVKTEGYIHSAGRDFLLFAVSDKTGKTMIECRDPQTAKIKWTHSDITGVLGITGLTPFSGTGGIKGLLIKETSGNIAGEALPFKPDDIILSIDNNPLRTAEDLKNILRGRNINDILAMTVMRGTSEINLACKVFPRTTAGQESDRNSASNIRTGLTSSGKLALSYGASMYCLDANSGTAAWKYVPRKSELKISEMFFMYGRIIALANGPSDTTLIICLDEATGDMLWERVFTDPSSPPQAQITVSMVFPHINSLIIRQQPAQPKFSVIDCLSGIEKCTMIEGTRETQFGENTLVLFPEKDNSFIKGFDLAMPEPEIAFQPRVAQNPGVVETSDSLLFTKAPGPGTAMNIYGYRNGVFKLLASTDLPANSRIKAFRDELYAFNSQKPYPSANQLQYSINIYPEMTAQKTGVSAGPYKLPAPFTIFLPLDANNERVNECLDDVILLADMKTILCIDRATRKITGALEYDSKKMSLYDFSAKYRRIILSDEKNLYIYIF